MEVRYKCLARLADGRYGWHFGNDLLEMVQMAQYHLSKNREEGSRWKSAHITMCKERSNENPNH